jgi:phage tail tube protein FII
MDYNKYIEANTLRVEASGRGGGIEIDLSTVFPEVEEPKMSAYQNYLGGGMLGSIGSNINFDRGTLDLEASKKLDELEEALKRYFHNLTNHVDDEWEEASFEDNQNRPSSAY